jgi:hypothetical protein
MVTIKGREPIRCTEPESLASLSPYLDLGRQSSTR